MNSIYIYPLNKERIVNKVAPSETFETGCAHLKGCALDGKVLFEKAYGATWKNINDKRIVIFRSCEFSNVGRKITYYTNSQQALTEHLKRDYKFGRKFDIIKNATKLSTIVNAE